MKHTELITLLETNVTVHGSQRAYARALGITAVHLGKVLAGTRMPGEKMLDRLELQKNPPTYEYKIKKGNRVVRSDAPKPIVYYRLDGPGGWFVVGTTRPNDKMVRRVGVEEFGRGNATVTRADAGDVAYYANLRGEIEILD